LREPQCLQLMSNFLWLEQSDMCSKRRGNLIVGSARKELLATAVTLVNQQFRYAKLV
jgi:hypothetical protein